MEGANFSSVIITASLELKEERSVVLNSIGPRRRFVDNFANELSFFRSTMTARAESLVFL